MKKIGFAVLAMIMCVVSVFGAFAEEPVPSVSVGAIVVPEGVTVSEELTVYVAPVQENKVEAKVFENIVKTVEETSVKEYFGEEVMTEVAAYIPEEIVIEEAENIQIDEFFALSEEGYDAEYGDLDVTFEFATQYEDDAVLVAMIGILPDGCKVEYEEGEELEEGLEIQWIPVETTVVEGKVQIKLTQDIMDMLSERNVVLALLNINGEPAADEAAE